LVADNQQDNTHEKSFHTRLPKRHEEQHNLDIALENLISQKQIIRGKDKDGFTTYKLVA
jgi:hypothetical protein